MTKKERRVKRERKKRKLLEKEERRFKALQEKYAYEPIYQHECSRSCKVVAGVHERALIWDDFELSQRKREKIDMEVVRSRGHLNHEMILLRMFQSTLDGSFIIRLQTATNLTQEQIGELIFESRDDQTEYYNNAIRAFGFTEVSPVRDDLEDFFEDESLDSFFGPDEDLDSFFGDDLDTFFGGGPKDDLDAFFG